MGRLCLQRGVGGKGLGSLEHRFVIGRNEAGFDRGARPRPAFEQSALDQQKIDALAGREMRSCFALGLKFNLDAGARRSERRSRAAARATQTSNDVKSCQMSTGFSPRQHERCAIEVERVDHHEIVVMAEILNGQSVGIDQAVSLRRDFCGYA